MRCLPLFLLLAAGMRLAANASPVLTNCLEISHALATTNGLPVPFSLTATSLTGYSQHGGFSIIAKDKTGTVALHSSRLTCPKNLLPGNIIQSTGTICIWSDGKPETECTSFDIIATGQPPTPLKRTIAEFLRGDCDFTIVQVTGRIKDVFYDEIDPRFIFFALADATDVLYATLPTGEGSDKLFHLQDAFVSVTGICRHDFADERPYQGRMLGLHSSEQIHVITMPPHSPFDDPTIKPLPSSYSINQSSGERVIVSGQVISRWQGCFFLIRDDSGRLMTVEAVDKSLPDRGDFVEVVGIPTANLYQLHLQRAAWRKSCCAHPTTPADAPRRIIDMSVRELLTNADGRRSIQVGLHGQTIRIIGDVRSIPSSCDFGERLYLQCEGFTAPVDVGNIPEVLQNLIPGCRVSVTGTCIMDITGITASTPFPRIKGFFLIPNALGDIRILRRPSWWTARRLIGLIGILLLILAGSLVWNIALHRLAEKKGKELAAESMAHAESEIKIYERTRLAVELHDSIAQNLTGAALEIRAANRSHEDCDGLVPEHLDIALKTVDSCRNELRNCIWDLRNQSLEETDIDEAIRLTLQPVIGTTRLTVRFNVPRSIFSDPTIHTILCIIRELAVNGIRHGRASALKIAGAIENGHLLFSVKDNGCGYDTTRAPGMRNGHFGLQGIRERIRPYNGQFHVTSVPGQGTRTTIDIKLPSSMQS